LTITETTSWRVGRWTNGGPSPEDDVTEFILHGKNGFVTATKLGTTKMNFLLLQPKIFLQQPNVLLTELKILLLKQNIFVIAILTNDFVGITKPFLPCKRTYFINIALGYS